MKLAAVVILLALGTSGASAACIGSGALRTCFDDAGNNYTVQQFGNTTIVDGRNSRTGSSWNQTSQTLGNTTFHNGRDKDGNSWNSTQQTNSFGTTFSGRDSSGNSFYKTCTQFGCY